MRFFVVFILCLYQLSSFAGIRINEVMQSNVNGIMDDLNEFPDSWVELYNEDTTAFDFTGYSISLSKDFSESFPLMEPTIIKPKGYLLIYCDKEDGRGPRHTDFRLECDEESCLYVFDLDGSIVDSLVIPEMLAPDVSYGRITDGNDTLSYFKRATPNAPNGGFYTTRILKKPRFSVEGGVFNHPFSLHLSLQGDCPADAVIRYTTNGSEPSEDSPIAPDSLYIEETTVIRAKTFSDSALSKVSKTESYLFLDRDVTIPILSVVVDSLLMWDQKVGIYLNIDDEFFWKSYYAVNRRPANFEYFVDGQSVINQLGEMNIGGNTTKTVDLKSLVLRANKRFGEKHFKYKFWDAKDIKKTKSLYVRNSGQDNISVYMRDALIQTVACPHIDIDWAAYQPCVLYINGAYYGVMNLRERSNEDNIWQNYGGLENIDLISQTFGYMNEIKEGDDVEWEKTDSLFVSDSSTYADFEKKLDVKEFINFFLINSLFANTDFPGNNTVFWRERKEDEKWRWIYKDGDWGLGMTTPYDYAYLNYLTRIEPFDDESETPNRNPESASFRYRRFLSLPEVKNMFVDMNAVYLGTFLSSSNFTHVADSLFDNVRSEIEYMQKWPRSPIQGEWNENTEFVKKWYDLRTDYYYQHLVDFFSLGDTTSLKIVSSKRKLYFNNVLVENGRFDGRFFSGRPLYLSENDTAFKYVGDSIAIVKEDSVSKKEDGSWFVSYVLDDANVKKRYYGKSLFFVIPEGAKNVFITDEGTLGVLNCDSLKDISIAVENFDCGVSVESVPTTLDLGFDVFGNGCEAQMDVDLEAFLIGANTVKWSYVDAFGDTSVCNQTIFVEDLATPALDNCEAMDTLLLYLAEGENTVLADEVLKFTPQAEDNCAEIIEGVWYNQRDTLYVGESTVDWIFSDKGGNFLQCQQTVVVKDTIKPVVENCDSLPELQLTIPDDQCGFSVSEVGLTAQPAWDNCGSVEYELLPSDSLYIGENNLLWVYTDEVGNVTQCRQLVTVRDEYAPVYADCDSMPDLTFEVFDDACGLKWEELHLSAPVAEDNCSLKVVGIPVATAFFFLGETVMQWKFCDVSGNKIYCPQKVTVLDRYVPVYENCGNMPRMPFYVTDNLGGYPKENMNLPVPVARDNCNAYLLAECDLPEIVPVGEHVAHWRFKDAAGNELVCEQRISIENRFPPEYADCESMPEVIYDIREDYCAVPYEQIKLDIPVATGYAGDVIPGTLEYVPFVFPIGETKINWLFVDSDGNMTKCGQTVVVNDRAAPFADCSKMDTIFVELPVNANQVDASSVEIPIQKAVDNCNVVIVGQMEAEPYYKVGDNTIRWTFADAVGNSSTCCQVVKGVKHFVKRLYPNPVEDFLYVEGTEVGDEITVVNTLGQRMCVIKADGNPTILSFYRYASGVYSVFVNGELYRIVKN